MFQSEFSVGIFFIIKQDVLDLNGKESAFRGDLDY